MNLVYQVGLELMLCDFLGSALDANFIYNIAVHNQQSEVVKGRVDTERSQGSAEIRRGLCTISKRVLQNHDNDLGYELLKVEGVAHQASVVFQSCSIQGAINQGCSCSRVGSIEGDQASIGFAQSDIGTIATFDRGPLKIAATNCRGIEYGRATNR